MDGDLQDPTRSDLFEYVVDFLSFCPNLDLVWKHADWALKREQKVRMFVLFPLSRLCMLFPHQTVHVVRHVGA